MLRVDASSLLLKHKKTNQDSLWSSMPRGHSIDLISLKHKHTRNYIPYTVPKRLLCGSQSERSFADYDPRILKDKGFLCSPTLYPPAPPHSPPATTPSPPLRAYSKRDHPSPPISHLPCGHARRAAFCWLPTHRAADPSPAVLGSSRSGWPPSGWRWRPYGEG